MKTIRHLITLILCAAAVASAQTESIDDKAPIAGTAVDAANDFTLVRDASVSSGPALKKLPLDEYIDIPGFFGAVSKTELLYLDGVTSAIQTQIDAKQATIADGDLSIAKTSGLQGALDAKLGAGMNTNKLLGRNSTDFGQVEEITLGTNLSFTGTTLNATGGGSGASTNAEVNALLDDSPHTSLRAVKAMGYGQMTSLPNKLWRIPGKMMREGVRKNTRFVNRFRVVTLGDSVAASIQEPVENFWGFGGMDLELQSWVPEAGASPSESNGANYPTWVSSGTGVFTLYDEWARTVGGIVRNLDASKTGGTYIEKTSAGIGAGTYMNSLAVQYLAGPNGALSFGSFKLQYKQNGAGGWTECTLGTILTASAGGSVAAGVVNTNNSGSETYATAMFSLPAYDNYHLRIVATAGQVRICNTSSNAGAWFFNNAASTDQITGGSCINYAQGGRSINNFDNYSQTVLNNAFADYNPNVIVIKNLNYYTVADYVTSGKWETLAAKLRTAAPEALLVVCGSHPIRGDGGETSGALEVDDYLRNWCANTDGAIYVDVRHSFPEFVEGWQNPTSHIDDLWSDGTHIDGSTNPNFAGGATWVNQVVWEAIKPACEFFINSSVATRGWSNVTPNMPTEIRLHNGNVGMDTRSNIFSFTANPRAASKVVLRQLDSLYSGGTQQFFDGVGWHMRGARESVSPSGFSLIHERYGSLMSFGSNTTIGHAGFALGIVGSEAANAARANNGGRILSYDGTYGLNNGTILETRTGSQASTFRAVGFNLGSTDAQEGAPWWTWYPDGRTVNHGVVYRSGTLQTSTTVLCADTSGLAVGMNVWGRSVPTGATISSISANVSFVISSAATASGARDLCFTRAGDMTFTYGESASNVTIHTPSQSGTVAVVISGTGSLDYGSIAAGAEETLTVTVTGALTANTPSVSLGWSAGLPAGVMVKQAWVSGANTVSITLANYMTVSAVDPPSITCRATVNNF